MNKSLAGALLIILTSSFGSASRATEEQCLAIDAVKERMACFEQLEEADQVSKQVSRKPKPTIGEDPLSDQLSQLKNDDDLLKKRLKAICRGC